MGFLDKLLGREPLSQQRPSPAQPPTGEPYAVPAPRGGASSEDERAIARYKYLLRTADPEDIERVHADAFAKLSPEQRQMVLQRLTDDLPESERPRTDQPADLARSATRAEMSRPGYLQGAFAGGRLGGMGGMGMGGMFAGSMLGSIAGVVVGSALSDMMLDGFDSSPEAHEAGDYGGNGDGDNGDGDSGSGDSGNSGDSGGAQDAGSFNDNSSVDGSDVAGGSDFGDFGGGDFGGGDFGGGDFGGGDFGGF